MFTGSNNTFHYDRSHNNHHYMITVIIIDMDMTWRDSLGVTHHFKRNPKGIPLLVPEIHGFQSRRTLKPFSDVFKKWRLVPYDSRGLNYYVYHSPKSALHVMLIMYPSEWGPSSIPVTIPVSSRSSIPLTRSKKSQIINPFTTIAHIWPTAK